MKAHRDTGRANGESANLLAGCAIHFLGAWVAGRLDGRPITVEEGRTLLLESASLILRLAEETP